ncbi:MAG: tetratricopeptide repeat protein [Nitrospirae bacterium]|nr:tetratricopeptide repeat protein [Nitrospirota bacterium]
MKKNIANVTASPFWSKPAIHMIVIALVGLFVYSETFDAPFQWDEREFIANNPIIKNLSFFATPSAAKDLTYYDALKHRYIGYLTFALNYKIHGYDVFGYHIFNVFVHLINALLVYAIILLSFKTPKAQPIDNAEMPYRIATLTSIIFVAHPIQTEAITYIFQRLASLATFFYLLSFAAYIYSRLSQASTKKIGFYLLCVISCIAGMRTKEIMFTAPLIITLFELIFFSGGFKNRILFLLPILSTLLIIPLSHLGTERPTTEILTGIVSVDVGYAKIDRFHYFFTQFGVIIDYIKLLLLPINQCIDHDVRLIKHFWTAMNVGSLFVLILIFSAGLKLLTKRDFMKKLAGFGIIWFFITISVESTIIPLPTIMNEYRVYLPSFGFFTALSVGLIKISDKLPVDGRSRFLGAILLISVLAGSSYVRNAVWTSDIALWEDATIKSPKRHRTFNNLGNAYLRSFQPETALINFDKAIELYPANNLPYHSKAEAFLMMGEFDKAEKNYKKSLQLNPKYFKSYIGLGLVATSRDSYDEAEESYLSALKLNPMSALALNGMGFIRFKQKKYSEAHQFFDKAIISDPFYGTAYLNKGTLFLAEGLNQNALEAFNKGCSLGNSDACKKVKALR